MSSPINPISIGGLAPLPIESPGKASQPGEFQKVFESAIHRVENLRNTANQSVEQFLSGEKEELHDVIMDTQRAQLAFDLFLQVRNKVVAAYQEVMRMQM
jgi:flagellar hook-basal body complex protein FliE